MSEHDQHEHDDEPQRPRRDTIMQRRLRARGERGEHDEPPPHERERPAPRRDYDDDEPPPREPPPRRRAYDDEPPPRKPPPRRRAYDDDEPPPRARNMRQQFEPPDYAPVPASSGGGCARAVLYLVVGALITLLIVFFFFGQAAQQVGEFLNLPEMSGPTATPFMRSNTPIVLRVQQLQRLETTSYTIENVIEAGREGGNVLTDPFERDRLLLIARGRVEAGIDLRNLRESDVIISPDGSTLTVNLPPVQIFSVTLDNEQTRVYDRDTGLFASPDQNLETQARQEAEDRILTTACEDGVLQRATEDSRRAMEQFLSLLEFETVQVNTAPVPPCVAPTGDPAPAPPPEPAPQP
jgi:hypothetical protein